MRTIFSLLLLPCAAAFAGDDALQQVFQRMDKASVNFKGFTSNFTKIDHNELIEANDTSVGTFALRKSGPRSLQVLEKIDTQEGKPNPVLTEFNGTRVTIYRPKANPDTATEYEFGKKYRGVEEAAIGVFGGSSKDLQQDYKVAYGGAEAVNGQPAARLILSPNEPELAKMFPKMEIWISDATGMAVQQKFYEKGGKDYHLLTYSDMKLGPVAESQVRLNLPRNVKKEHPH
jgi:outer membrane lipoprotein-sorting protein